MYIYIYICACVYIAFIYIYIYILRERDIKGLYIYICIYRYIKLVFCNLKHRIKLPLFTTYFRSLSLVFCCFPLLIPVLWICMRVWSLWGDQSSKMSFVPYLVSSHLLTPLSLTASLLLTLYFLTTFDCLPARPKSVISETMIERSKSLLGCFSLTGLVSFLMAYQLSRVY